VNRNSVFFGPDDYRLYLAVLRHATDEFGCEVHAYVLMTNHVHLLLTPQSAHAISRVFQAIGRCYVQTINRKYGRSGTLWEGRYRASIVDSTTYLLTCYRYIELNPVRADMVSTPELYRYSSHGFNALGRPDGLVTPHAKYLALAADAERRQARYRDLFGETIAAEDLRTIRDCANASQVLGNERFKDQIAAVLGRSVRPGKAGRPRITRTQ
jgi:putative transposase